MVVLQLRIHVRGPSPVVQTAAWGVLGSQPSIKERICTWQVGALIVYRGYYGHLRLMVGLGYLCMPLPIWNRLRGRHGAPGIAKARWLGRLKVS